MRCGRMASLWWTRRLARPVRTDRSPSARRSEATVAPGAQHFQEKRVRTAQAEVGARHSDRGTPTMAFTTEEITYLESQPLARLATVSADGQPDAVPVGFEFDGTDFYVSGH